MATNYKWINYTDSSGRDFGILETNASNIKLVNIFREKGACKTVEESGYYGMNASFFNAKGEDRYPAIHNIAFQSGSNMGCGIPMPNQGNILDGSVNITGSSLVYWTGSVLNCVSNVQNSSSSYVPKTANSWAQGGFGLYLCDVNWQSKYEAENNASSYPVEEGAARTGILINKSTKKVYLISSRIMTTTVRDLRNGMMSYAGLTQGGSAGSWAAIMTDGGQSTQLYSGEGSNCIVFCRAVPQIIALKKTT